MSPNVDRRKIVAVIGDASLESGCDQERLAEEVGKLLVDAGFRVLTGGLGGVMEAACRGAKTSPSYRSGDTIGLLPGHDPADANPFIDIAIPTGLDHARNGVVAHADAIIAIGGGAGTLIEIAFAWIYRRLVIGMKCGGWSSRLADQRIDHRVRYKDIPDDRIYGASSAAEAVDLVRQLLPLHRANHRSIARR